MRSFYTILILTISASIAVSCSSTKEQLGLSKKSPDEFAVVKRAPLELPPSYTLAPPRPGAARPQETSPNIQAKEAVLGASTLQAKDGVTAGESVLLQKAGTGVADPSIRAKVDEESNDYDRSKIPAAKKLFGLVNNEDPPEEVVDAEQELERLQQNAAEGKPATEGETPSVER